MPELIQIPAFSAHVQGMIAESRSKLEAKNGRMRLEFTNAKDGDAAEIAIYGIIGDPYDGANASTFGRFLRENKKRAVNVRINSPGGLAYDGITIHNALLQHDGHVTTSIEGEAGSAASIIAVAGSTVRIFENATFFIHRAGLVVAGNADVFREALNWLTQLDDSIARTYRAKTGKSLDKIMEQMVGVGGDGTPFTARDALSNRYVDEIVSLKRPDGKAKAEREGNSVNRAARNEVPPVNEAMLKAHEREQRKVRLGL